jgi:hypothetical protein
VCILREKEIVRVRETEEGVYRLLAHQYTHKRLPTSLEGTSTPISPCVTFIQLGKSVKNKFLFTLTAYQGTVG